MQASCMEWTLRPQVTLDKKFTTQLSLCRFISSQQQFKKELIHCRISFLQKCKSASAEQHYLSTFMAQAIGGDIFLEDLTEFVECESYSNVQPQYRDGDRRKKTGTWTVWKEANFILRYDFRYNLLSHCLCSTSVIKKFEAVHILCIYIFFILLNHYILLKHKVKDTGSHSSVTCPVSNNLMA